MNKTLIKQSFLAALAASLTGLTIYYLFAFWFDSDNRLNIIEFLLLAMFLMPIAIGTSLVFFSLHFLSDYYRENNMVKNYQTFICLLVFTGLNTVVLDQGFFLVNKDIPQAFVRVYEALDESYKESGKASLEERIGNDPDFSIEEIGNYAPWFQNMISLSIIIPIASGLSTGVLRRSTKIVSNFV
jgi:hypothetical protein